LRVLGECLLHLLLRYIHTVLIVFVSMWPLLRRDGQAVQYIALLLLWNYLIGYNPFRQMILKYLTLATYSVIAILHAAEVLMTPPARYPDLFPVLNALLCAGIFGLCWLWSIKRLVELSWAMGSLRRNPHHIPPSSPAIRTTKLLPIGPTNRIPPVMDTMENMMRNSNGSMENGDGIVQMFSSSSAPSSLRRRNPMSRDPLSAIPGGPNEWSHSPSETRGSIDLGDEAW
jgi:ALG6, ALG8 glycosyltransferase family